MDEQHGMVVRRRVREAWQDTIQPALARALDATGVTDDEVLHVTRVELDFVVATQEELEELLSFRLGEALQGRIVALVAAARAGQPEGGSRLIDQVDWLVRVLERFLVKGLLPRAAPERPRDALAAALLQPAGLRMLVDSPRPAPVWFRALQLVVGDLLPPFLEGVSAAMAERHGATAWPAAWLPMLQRWFGLAIAGVRAASPASATAGREHGSVTMHDRMLIAAVWFAAQQTHRGPHGNTLLDAVREASTQGVASAPDSILDLARHVVGASPGSSDSAAARQLVSAARPAPPIESRARVDVRSLSDAAPTQEAVADARVRPVSSAGLVLLHPYLRQFLHRQGLLREGTLPAAERPRAAALLHLLVNGTDNPDPFHPALVHLLLGQSPDETLLVGPGLVSDADLGEADGLLRAVVGHWAVLKNTTPSGFRRAFLQRQGWLRRHDQAWQLTVEPAPHDVLLDHLPWGIGTVHLSWMSATLHVEWGRS